MLETKRTLLRPPTENDLENIHPLYCDPEYQKFIGGSSNIEASKKLLDDEIDRFKKDGYGMLTISKKEERAFMGFCQIQCFKNLRPSKIEIIYALLPEFRRNGYVAEAIIEVLRWAFSKIGMDKIGTDEIDTDKIIARVDPENTTSRKLLEKLKFKKIKDYENPNTDKIENVFCMNKSRFIELYKH